jgi:MFS family permease
MGLFQTYYQETLLLNYSASAISWIFTIQLFLMFVSQPQPPQLRHLLTGATCSRWTGGAFFGRVIDTYGTHHVAIPCSIACVIFIILLSLCTTYSQIFLAQGVGFGLAASGLFSCGIVSVGQWFHKRKAFALGLVLMGSSTGIAITLLVLLTRDTYLWCIGGVVHPIYLQILIREIGWPAAVRCCALIIAVASSLACLLMRGRLPKKKWDRSRRFFDFALFKSPVFSAYSVGTFFVM